MKLSFQTSNRSRQPRSGGLGSLQAFTFIELFVIILSLGFMALLLAPALAKTGTAGKSIRCLNNQRQLMTAWRMYAADNAESVIYNLTVSYTEIEVANKTYRNWANNVMSWDADSMCTNVALLQVGLLAPYYGANAALFKCPADNCVSQTQMILRWTGRTRSVSMNGFFGLNDPTGSSHYVPFPGYRQWLRISEVLHPAKAWVLIEEHPDSINDGYFIVDPSGATVQWGDVPAALHNGGCTLGFADGHVELHKWLSNTSKLPVRFYYRSVPFDPQGRIDSRWLTSRTAELDR